MCVCVCVCVSVERPWSNASAGFPVVCVVCVCVCVCMWVARDTREVITGPLGRLNAAVTVEDGEHLRPIAPVKPLVNGGGTLSGWAAQRILPLTSALTRALTSALTSALTRESIRWAFERSRSHHILHVGSPPLC